MLSSDVLARQEERGRSNVALDDRLATVQGRSPALPRCTNVADGAGARSEFREAEPVAPGPASRRAKRVTRGSGLARPEASAKHRLGQMLSSDVLARQEPLMEG